MRQTQAASRLDQNILLHSKRQKESYRSKSGNRGKISTGCKFLLVAWIGRNLHASKEASISLICLSLKRSLMISIKRNGKWCHKCFLVCFCIQKDRFTITNLSLRFSNMLRPPFISRSSFACFSVKDCKNECTLSWHSHQQCLQYSITSNIGLI